MSQNKKEMSAQLDREITAARMLDRAARGGGNDGLPIIPRKRDPKSGRHWEVLAMIVGPRGGDHVVGLVDGQGFVARCGHRHSTQGEATMCPWEPSPWPERCDLYVREVRTPDKNTKPEQGTLFR